MATYTCPYCFSQHEIYDVEFRCVNASCGMEDDQPLTTYEGAAVPLKRNKVFPPQMKGFRFIAKKFMPAMERCPSCRTVSSFRLCPSCHNMLPPHIDDHEDMIISIVGSRGSGKSHYIGVLIDELQKHIIPELFGGNFMETDKSIRDQYMQKYYYPLYQLGKPLDLTNPNEKQKPLIYETNIGEGNRVKHLTFIFYDTAGENYEDLMTMTTVNKYICQSAGIIFLVDPSQVEEIRDNMDEKILDEASNIPWQEIARSTPDAIIDRVARLIRQFRGMKPGKKIDIPVAVAFSKLDAIKELLPPGSMVAEPSGSIKSGRYDKDEARIIDEEMRTFLNTWGERRITTAMKANFSNIAYFGVSALGQSPQTAEGAGGARKIQKPRPERVEDPFLWLLYKTGVIK